MAIINSSARLYGAAPPGASFETVTGLSSDFAAEVFSPSAGADFAAITNLSGDFAAEVYTAFADADCVFDTVLSGDFAFTVYTPGETDFAAVQNLSGDINCDTALVLQNPAPITVSVAANAFSNQLYAGGGGRLFINNVETKLFVSADINAPPGNLGVSLQIELAEAARLQLPNGATLKFQIGKIVNNIPVWTTILDGGKLAGSRFSMTVNRDTLSFSTFETNSKLNKFPRNNLIVFDAAKASVSAQEIEPLPTNTNEFIGTTTLGISVLTLYKLLEIAFVTGCGFSSFQTDLPNYEIARCDFTVTNSYHDAIKQFVGMYEPLFSTNGDVLRIQKTIDPLPPGFTPNSIQASVYPNFTENLQNNANNLDGYILNYTGGAGSFYADRNLPNEIIPSGTFGTADFTETTTRRKMRDWFETGGAAAVRSELKEEIRETRRNGVIVGRETKTNKFDRLGRAKGFTNSIEARMPDVSNGNAPTLLKTREEAQTIFYQSNPFAPRQTVLNRVETSIKSLLAIDSENTALDQNGEDSAYAQNYEKVFEAGNLQSGMTSSFQTLDFTTEQFRPLANGQTEVRVTVFDALRGKLKPSPPVEVRSGDISVRDFTKQKTKTIFRNGVTQATRTGELKTINTGELPLFFAEPLVNWLLANPRTTGQIELIGWDASVTRGVSFTLLGREGESLGKFLIRGYRVLIKPRSIMTNLDALKVG